MSGDLLEDLMSSEGEFVCRIRYNVCNEKAFEYISALTLRASFYAPCTSHLLLCVLHLQCSRLSSVCRLHPATTTTYTTWTRQKACVTSLTSPFWTSDLWDRCQFSKHANLPSFFSKFPPPLPLQWRWEEVQESYYDLMSVQGHLCTDTVGSRWAQWDSSSMYSLVKKYRQEQKILLTAFFNEI